MNQGKLFLITKREVFMLLKIKKKQSNLLTKWKMSYQVMISKETT